MCGIFGVISLSGSDVPDRQLLERSAEILRHRGPDDSGTHSDPGIGLAHTRLSLLDLSPRSSQPFWDKSGTNCLVYNGEVYNFAELRSKLEAEGVSFRTTSDTEVVLEAILAWGVDRALQSFEGMFAFAIFEADSGRVTLARDRFGIKPLFVSQNGERMLFASEIEALRPWMDLQPDLRTLTAFLYGSGGPTSGRTFFEGIAHLTPGSVMTISPTEGVNTRRFTSLTDFWNVNEHELLASRNDSELLDIIERLLQDSVDRQLMADAPVGVLCSGGVDSSLILAMAARSHGDMALFHADVVGPTSERQAAHALADHLGLELNVIPVHDDDFLDLLPKLTRHHASPFLMNPHAVPFYRVSQLIRDSGVKAMLSGEGADEAFLGYAWAVPGRASRRSNRAASNPSRTLLAPPHRTEALPHARQTDLVTSMLEGFTTDREHLANQAAISATGKEAQAAVQTLDLLHSNLRGLLHRNDTMGMAASVESRFPFLDTELIRQAVNIPARIKFRMGWYPKDRRHPLTVDKWAIRQIADRWLPRELSRRPKVPFATTAYARMKARPGLFRDGFIADVYGLGIDDVEYLLSGIGSRVSKLVHLETWGRICVQGIDEEEMIRLVRDNTTLD